MPITTTCPGCKSLFRLPDTLSGKQVRCQKCANLFVVPQLFGGLAESTVAAPPPEPEPIHAPEPPRETPPEPEPEAAAPQADPAAKPPQEEPAPVVVEPKAEPPKPPPAPKTPLFPERPPSVLRGLAMLALFALGTLGVGMFAVIWIATHLGPPIVMSGPPPIHGAPKNGGAVKGPANLVPAAPQEMVLGADGGLFWNNQGLGLAPGLDHGKWSQDGPYHLYRVRLQEGVTYNFLVRGHAGVIPRLRIYDDPARPPLVDRGMQHDRLMVGFKPDRTADYLLWVTDQKRNFGQFDVAIARQSAEQPTQVDMTVQPVYMDGQPLLMQDALDPAEPRCSTYRDYDVKLEADKEYVISLTMLAPVLRVHDQPPANVNGLPPQRVAQTTFRPPNDGKYRVRVCCDFNVLERYTLKIAVKGQTLQTIIVQFDDRGIYTDRRTLTASDPVVPGEGSYKEYLAPLEKGKKYRIEMSLGEAATSVSLYDPKNEQVAGTFLQKDASVTHLADVAGVYRIRVAAPRPRNGQAYVLRITPEP
jgi:predicted Zn finger-like uncharacterized protein